MAKGWSFSGSKLLDLVPSPTEVPKVSEDGRKDLIFRQGQLGFSLECMHVMSVDKERQAYRLGVEVGDRLIRVDGRNVPEFDPGDAAEEQRVHDLVTQWLEEMPLPATLTFETLQGTEEARPQPAPSAKAAPAPAGGSGEAVAAAAAAAADLGFDATLTTAAPAAADGTSGVASAPLGGRASSAAAGGDAGGDASEWAAAGVFDVGGPGAEASGGDLGSLMAAQLEAEMELTPAGDAATEEEAQVSIDEELLLADAATLRLELQRDRRELSRSAEQLREERRNSANLWKQLAVLKRENKQILEVQSRATLENSEALETAKRREQSLRDEVERLKQVVAATGRSTVEEATKSAAAAEASLQELRALNEHLAKENKDASSKVAAAETRAATAEMQAESLRKQVAGLEAEQETVVRMHQERQERWEREVRLKFEDQERLHKAREEEAVKRAEQERQYWVGVAGLAADAETGAGGSAEAATAAAEVSMPQRSPGDSKEVSALYDRIDLLTKRCAALQKKLAAASNPTAGVEVAAPKWAATLVSLVGLRVGETILRGYTAANVVMVRTAQLLLQREVLRWAFFAQLVFLYTIAASWYVQSVKDPTSPVDQLNMRLDRATAVATASAVTAAVEAPHRGVSDGSALPAASIAPT